MSARDTTLLDEKAFFVRISRGDEKAFAHVFYHYVPRLSSFIERITRSAEVADELVQEVFLSLWTNREKLADVESCSAYIFTIAANKTFNYLKSRTIREKYLVIMTDDAQSGDNNTIETIDFNESQCLVNKLVDQLSSQKKTIYRLTRDRGMSHDEVAVRLGISKNTVKNHLVETLRFLKESLRRYSEVSIILFILLIVGY